MTTDVYSVQHEVVIVYIVYRKKKIVFAEFFGHEWGSRLKLVLMLLLLPGHYICSKYI